jgi:hypothetical protein
VKRSVFLFAVLSTVHAGGTIRSSRRLEVQLPTRTMIGARHKSLSGTQLAVCGIPTVATGRISVYGHGSEATSTRPPPAHNLIGSTNSVLSSTVMVQR